MALHDTPASMLKESLNESLTVAEYCLAYRKNDGGCLGYPAAMILFSIVDTIGSYFRKNKNLRILIDGKTRFIDSDGYKHFFILNSPYFEQHLSEKVIKTLYIKFRSLLLFFNTPQSLLWGFLPPLWKRGARGDFKLIKFT
jgi:hypothetical protein